uniref:Tetraspanin n=1 Tax=Aplanochytrium stocchinoi TaxID=215587 RepID=A0A7S3LH43_9STRA|mmetsp:Transcript_15909/g.19732  ORF Transcript_15909/g.19732 Transcript_15909/m.19732 type:complete len:315 (+) Transcript_15909:391-1335(+)
MEAFKELFRFEEGHEPRKADNLYRMVLILSMILTFMYTLATFLFLAFAVGDEFQNLAMLIAPRWAVALLALSVLNGLIANGWMTAGFVRYKRRWLSRSYFLAFPLIIINLFIFVFLQMRGNGITALPEYADAENGKFAMPTLELITQYAMDNKKLWFNLQRDLGCCGLNMFSCYGDDVFDNIDNFNIFDLISFQQECAPRNITIFSNLNTKSPEQAAEDQFVDFDQFFWCEDELTIILRQYAKDYGIYFGVMTLIQLFIQFGGARLFFSYMESEGGFKPDYDKYVGARAVVEETVLQKAGYNPKSSAAKSGLKF